jgi:Putative bacterial lipoprotein (DUF799)
MSYCSSKRLVRPARLTFLGIAMLTVTAAGCSTKNNQETRPFFLPEQKVETHGRKTWFDHLVEVDPGRMHYQVAADYSQDPPERIAVLPFADRGSAQWVVNKIPLTFRNVQERQEWSWTDANRLRRSFVGELAEREFIVIPTVAIDAVLADHGITDGEKLNAVSPQQLGRWLGADAVVYGEVLNYEAYYGLLIAGWEVGVNVKMVSTRDGHEVFSASDQRFSTDLQPAFDPVDIAINSGMTLLELRDVNLARAEQETGREIVLRLPVSQLAIKNLQEAALARADEWTDTNDAADSMPTHERPSADSAINLKAATYLTSRRH